MKKIALKSTTLIMLSFIALIVPSGALALSLNKEANIPNYVNFSQDNYTVSLYPSYNEGNKKVQTNLQIKDNKTNKVSIFKDGQFFIKKSKENNFYVYIIEVTGFGRFKVTVDSDNKDILSSDYTSFSNASAIKIPNVQIVKPTTPIISDPISEIIEPSIPSLEDNKDTEVGGAPDVPAPPAPPYVPPTQISVMILGDSNSQPLLPGVPHSQQPYFIQDRGFINWGDVLSNRVANEGIIISTINLSVGATTVSDQNTLNTYGDPNINGTPFLTQAKLNQIASYGYVDYVVIALGTNDIIEKVGDGSEGTGIFINNLVNFIGQVALQVDFKKLIIIEPPMIRPTTLSNGTVVYSPEQAQMVNNYSQAIWDMQLYSTQLDGLEEWYGFNTERVVTRWMITDSDINFDGIHLLQSGEEKLGNYMFQPLNLFPDTEIHGGGGGGI